GTRNPGISVVPLALARMKKVSLRIMAIDIPAQDVITRDNISVKVNAVLYMRVADPALAVMEIQDYLYATGQLAQTTLLSVLAQAARVLQSQPASIQLRYLQTVSEIAAENNSTTIFPIPIDMLRPFFQRAQDAAPTADAAANTPAKETAAPGLPRPAAPVPPG